MSTSIMSHHQQQQQQELPKPSFKRMRTKRAFFLVAASLSVSADTVAAFRSSSSPSTHRMPYRSSTTARSVGGSSGWFGTEEPLEGGGSLRPSRMSAVSVRDEFVSMVGEINDDDETNPLLEQPTTRNWLQTSLMPVISAACLVTGNTVGAGCLVMPQVAEGPGMLATTGLFGAAWLLNLVSGLVLAHVAITLHDGQLKEQLRTGSEEPIELPTSFQDLAATTLGGRQIAVVVSSLSVFVNSCVLSFDLNRVGALFSDTLATNANLATGVWAAGLVGLLVTASTETLSLLCTAAVTALFVSFGGLLLPGLAAVPDVTHTILAPGTCPDCIVQAFPVVLMSMVYQNIVPTVTKLLDYDRTKITAALSLGSLVPMLMYLSWCVANLGGGVATAANGLCLTLFGLATLSGSSLCSGMSLTAEVGTFMDRAFAAKDEPTRTTNGKDDDDEVVTAMPTEMPGFSLPVASVAVSVPLAAAYIFGSDGGLTSALELAGGIGSPILYGLIPAAMAWRSATMSSESSPTPDNPIFQAFQSIPKASFPILAGLSCSFMGQEMWVRAQDMLTMVAP